MSHAGESRVNVTLRKRPADFLKGDVSLHRLTFQQLKHSSRVANCSSRCKRSCAALTSNRLRSTSMVESNLTCPAGTETPHFSLQCESFPVHSVASEAFRPRKLAVRIPACARQNRISLHPSNTITPRENIFISMLINLLAEIFGPLKA